jgi:sugar-specific transcriptional regulator TrmB
VAIARAADIKRTTVYSVIDALKQKGLMTTELHGLKQRFCAQHPEKLEQLLETHKQHLATVMPDLVALYQGRGQSSLIKQYDGLINIKSVYEKLITDIQPHQDYLVIGNQDQWYSSDEDYFQNFIERRAKLPIRIRMLLQDSATTQRFKKFEKNYHAEIKILPSKTDLTTNTVITPQRVVIHQLLTPMSALVIEHASIIQMHQQYFELMWAGAKK